MRVRSLERYDGCNPSDEGSTSLRALQCLVGKYRLSWKDIRYELYDERPDCYGVKFFAPDGYLYDVVCNAHLGERLLITHQTEYGHLRDVPFHMGTSKFLPEEVSVEVA